MTLSSLLIFPIHPLKALESSGGSAARTITPFPRYIPQQSTSQKSFRTQFLSFLPVHSGGDKIAQVSFLPPTRPILETHRFERELAPSSLHFYQFRPRGESRDVFFANQGHLYLEQGELRRAVFSYLIALTLNPQNLDIYFSLSNIYLSLKNYQLAQELLIRAEQIHGTTLSIKLEKVKVLLHSGNLELAQDYLEEIIETEPGNSVAWMYQGDIYRLSGRQDLALKSYKTAMVSEYLSAELAPRFGKVYMQQRDYLRAIAHFRSWAEQDPEDPEALYYLGVALVHQERYDEAQQVLSEALAIYLSRGDIQRSEAVQIFQQNLELTSVD
jgi:tetratricopeptide (TPR) repeat protein